MATLAELVAARELRKIALPRLGRHEYEERFIFGLPEFFAWLQTTAREATPFYAGQAAVKYQIHDFLKQYITGKPLTSPRMFRTMRPVKDDIYELKTADVRIFGWFYRKDVFIAVKGDLFCNVKFDESLYEAHRIECLRVRGIINLDEPKFVAGALNSDVLSNV
ncbi:hypothetical protein ACQ3G6_17430 [Allorhizobium undicola]